MHYKPCQLKNLSGRRSWDVFAFSTEFTNFQCYLKKLFSPRLRSQSQKSQNYDHNTKSGLKSSILGFINRERAQNDEA